MDLSNSSPIDDSRSSRHNPAHSVETNRGGPEHRSTASVAPEAEGPLPNSGPESGETRDAAAENQTKDRAGEPTNQVAETLRELSKALNVPHNHRVSIELDQESQEPLLYVRHVETGEVVRRIPTEDTAELLERLRSPSGNLLDKSF